MINLHEHKSLRSTTTQQIVQLNGNFIDTTVTSDATSVDAWIRSVRSSLNGRPTVVGLDCEWKPNTSKQENNKVATLQLCVEEKCLIIQLFHIDSFPHSLTHFLRDTKNNFVGVRIDEDIDKLGIDYRLHCGRSSDLVPEFKRYMGTGCPDKPLIGLSDCASGVLGFHVEKPPLVRRSNWEERTLTTEQVQYACIDAYVSYRLGRELLMGGNSQIGNGSRRSVWPSSLCVSLCVVCLSLVLLVICADS